MSTKKISVIVPVYNAEPYIEKCLYRLAHQTMPEMEVIIVNDGSTDNSQAIIDRYVESHPGIFRAYVKENGGVSAARNYGLDRAAGDYIGFVDSDDFVEFDMFEKLYRKAVADSCDLVACAFNRWYKARSGYEDNDYIIKPFVYDYSLVNNLDDRKQLICKLKPYLWNKIYRRELFENVRFTVGQVFEDDAVIYKLLLEAKKIGLVNEPLYNYIVQRAGSITNTVDRKIFDIFKACDSIIRSFKEKGVDQLYFSEMEYLCIVHIFARVRSVVNSKDIRLAFEFIDAAFKYLNRHFPNWRDNEHYLRSRIPKLVKHPPNPYERVRDSAFRLKAYLVLKPLLKKIQKIAKFLVRCVVAFEKLLKIISSKGGNYPAGRREKSQLTPEQTRELQKEVLDLLSKFDAYCQKHGLQYFLAEGSLLGAVRHKGFIPWDDDIDIMMPRDDYEKLIRCWGTNTIDQMKLLHHSTYKRYYLPFAKVITVGPTNFQSLMRIADEELLGPGIDIFPLDPCKNLLSREQIYLCRKMRKYRNAVLTKVGYIKRLPAKARYFWLSRIFSERQLLRKIDQLMQKYKEEDTEYIANFASSYPIHRECFKRSWFSQTLRVPFENIMVNIPSGYAEILATIYGDYMTLPPVEKRVNRHSYKWIGPEKKKTELERADEDRHNNLSTCS